MASTTSTKGAADWHQIVFRLLNSRAQAVGIEKAGPGDNLQCVRTLHSEWPVDGQEWTLLEWSEKRRFWWWLFAECQHLIRSTFWVQVKADHKAPRSRLHKPCVAVVSQFHSGRSTIAFGFPYVKAVEMFSSEVWECDLGSDACYHATQKMWRWMGHRSRNDNVDQFESVAHMPGVIATIPDETFRSREGTQLQWAFPHTLFVTW